MQMEPVEFQLFSSENGLSHIRLLGGRSGSKNFDFDIV